MNGNREELRHLGRCIREAVKIRTALRKEWEAAISGGAVRMNVGGKLSGWSQFVNETVKEARELHRKGVK